MKEFYFTKFEDRKPYSAIPANEYITLCFQLSAILTVFLGFSYLSWRWLYSLNPGALWFAVPLALAETLSFIGTILAVINFWSYKDAERTPPIHFLSEMEDLDERQNRPVSIDVFIATYNEDVELVRHSIADAKRLNYPFPDVGIKVYVLDDGRRDGRDPGKQNMKKVAEEENVEYLTREHNTGYKAGNLKNALEHTSGDLFVILDADTRAFPDLLVNTTGYFRKRKVAWVQTPQWFYDTSMPEKLSSVLNARLKVRNKKLKRILDLLFGKITVNEDIFGNDPRLFYDVILRKRNFFNAAFCCGAGSVHRREAVMGLALNDLVSRLNKKKLGPLDRKMLMLRHELTPFKYHASEDIYTSIMLHSDKENRWESIQHPDIECRMLSTQDLDSWVKQHQRYAEGSLDIAFRDNPLFKAGLTTGQKLCYFNTIWSYFAPLWILVFLLSPILFFFTLILPVQGYSIDFFKHFIPFQVMNTITITLGCWGIETKRGEQYYVSSFWYMLLSLISVTRGKKVKFNVTPKEKHFSKNTRHILPHMIILSLGMAGIIYNTLLFVTGNHPNIAGFAANTFWCLFNMISLSTMIRAAYWKPLETE